MNAVLAFLVPWTVISAEDICFRGYLHEKSTIYGAEIKPWSRISIDTTNAILYYTTDRENSSTNAVRFYQMPEFQGGVLFEIKTPWQLSVDRFTSNLYVIAGNDSTTSLNLYKYDVKTKNVTLLSEKIGDQDLYLYRFYAFKNQVYWIGGDSQMYRYKNGKIGKHNIRMVAYAEDIEGTIYFIKEKDDHNVYKVLKGDSKQLRYISKDFVANLKTDSEGNILAGSILSDRFYELNDTEGKLVRISDRFPYSTTYLHFDQANDIIGAEEENTFIKYTRTLKQCEYKD